MSDTPTPTTPPVAPVTSTIHTAPPIVPDMAPAPISASEFNSADYERMFGLPTGALAEAKDADSVLKLVQARTDQALVESLRLQSAPPAMPSEKPAAPKPEPANPLEQRIASLEKQIADSHKAQSQRIVQELQRRVSARIDSWKSDRYGVGTQRRYKQVQAATELTQLIQQHVAVLEAQVQSGQLHPSQVPTIEALVDRLRAWHDPDFKLEAPKAPSGVVGTPGAVSPSATGTPKNIYEALSRVKWGE